MIKEFTFAVLQTVNIQMIPWCLNKWINLRNILQQKAQLQQNLVIHELKWPSPDLTWEGREGGSGRISGKF